MRKTVSALAQVRATILHRRRFLALSACALATPAFAGARHGWQGIALGADVATSAKRWDHEILYHGYLRRWADLMNGHVG